MSDETLAYLPFNALSEFMRDDYRLEVVRSALSALPGLTEELRAPIHRLTKKVVQVPGFRNSAKAPAALKVKPTAEAFSKSHELAGAILAAWAAAHPELGQRMYDLLTSRGWEVLPVHANRAELPGFLTTWPKGEDFEVLNEAYNAAYPDSPETTDDVSLMAVWVSDRLPYDVEDDEEEVETGEDEA